MTNFLSRLFRKKKKTVLTDDYFLTPFNDAIEEIKKRKQDPALAEKVSAYLNADIPTYFYDTPVFYLARHLATPNFETQRFVHLLEYEGFRVILSQDKKDTFVSSNHLKKALVKLPIYQGFSLKNKKYSEIFQYETVVDINTINGVPFQEITTQWGQSLCSFHEELCVSFFKDRVQIVDDSEWIQRNNRGDLLEHYKKFLALFIVHGILFEDYLFEDRHEKHFIDSVLKPAFDWVETYFGCKPLITRLNPTSVESPTFWLAYPSSVKAIIDIKRTLPTL
jgi:hypothetical protein